MCIDKCVKIWKNKILQKKYYYRVYCYEEKKMFYIMCKKCYNNQPATIQKLHCNPTITNVMFKFGESKMLIEDLIGETYCEECNKYNNDEYYKIMNDILQ